MIKGFINPNITSLGEKLPGSLKEINLLVSYKEKIEKCPYKAYKWKFRFFLMSQISINPKIRFPRPKGVPCSLVTHRQTDRHIHTHESDYCVGTLSVFQEFFLQPIIKDRPNSMRLICTPSTIPHVWWYIGKTSSLKDQNTWPTAFMYWFLTS